MCPHTRELERSPPRNQSIVGHFCPSHEDSVMVNCGLDRNRFLVSDREFAGSSRVLLQRPPFCPIKNLTETQATSLPAEIRDQGVDVGVAVLLQSAGREVLLTRRSKNLSIFPNIWVPPGGHVEQDEQLLDAGLRELQEETGLWLPDGAFSWKTLALWESVYPPLLTRGLPNRHHVVIYLLLSSHESHQQLQMRFQPNEAEVSAYAWLEPQVLERVAATLDEAKGTKAAGHFPETVSITELEHSSVQTVTVPTAVFLGTAPARGDDVERVSTGTKFALRLWLQSL
ncbi:nucleoside diphosphate-linked moiety X motif 17 isoform X2 [Hemicordylus capensis]|uniref:nucleoside diphosphate-linked moiety X motif 17 isoform X2 n=1 Tax=Hemicordylus capensis TaxID=884348 RepID=UPI0023037D4F|nr:nucleoside diphosphate-linked moiety X motif 17 isoform X2 [Hemicordylus capensis]